MRYGQPRLLTVALATAIIGGCASGGTEVDELRGMLSAEKEQSSVLKSTVDSLESKLATSNRMVGTKNEQLGAYEKQLEMSKMSPSGALLPPGAKTGECYARVYIAPKFETKTKRLLLTEGAETVSATATRYEWAEERITTREASTTLTVIPARYDWVEETITVQEASEKLIVVPAVYKDRKEKVLVRAAYTTWKKGRGPIERIDDTTGEIMCLVEIPAEYKTITKHVIATPASTRTVAIPAKYKTVKRRVLAEAAKTVEVEVPAQYKTLKVKRVAEAPREVRNPTEERYQEVTETHMISDGRLAWRAILCETNTTGRVVNRLQSALQSNGYRPGPIDGVVGAQTMAAVKRYQIDKGLARGKLTIETLKKLGVM